MQLRQLGTTRKDQRQRLTTDTIEEATNQSGNDGDNTEMTEIEGAMNQNDNDDEKTKMMEVGSKMKDKDGSTTKQKYNEVVSGDSLDDEDDNSGIQRMQTVVINMMVEQNPSKNVEDEKSDCYTCVTVSAWGEMI